MENTNSSKIKGCFLITPTKNRKPGDHHALKVNKQLIINGKGEIIFFRRALVGSDFKVHPNGLLSYWTGRKFYIINKDLEVIDSVGCVNKLVTDSHDFLILPNGHFVLIGKEREPRDVSNFWFYNIKKNNFNEKIRGAKKATVLYDVIQELDANKKLVFQWSSKEYYKLEESNFFYHADTAHVDVTHFNSVDVNSNGDFLISCRHFDEVIKVRRSDGCIIWRMGGIHNQMKFVNDTIPFLGQHDARYTNTTNFSVFDNGHSYDSIAHSIRALEYNINDSLKTATLTWSYSYKKPISSHSAGNLQLVNKKLRLINYGNLKNRKVNINCELLDKNNKTLRSIYFEDTLASYRAYFYTKLPINLNQPKLKKNKIADTTELSVDGNYKYYLWSTKEEASKININQAGEYYVFVSQDGINYTRSKNSINIKSNKP